MKIIGVGVDIVNNLRIKKLIKNSLFISRIFSKCEINKSKKIKNKISYFAKRFAAKEAFVKSIGTGFRNDLNFKDISINNDKLGKPMIVIDNRLNLLIKKKFKINNYNFFLSLADEKNHSIAFVVFLR